MINFHLNGDIVRCPDIRAIHARANEIREKHRICVYNYHEDTCQAWQQSQKNALNESNFDNKQNHCSGRCFLAGSDLCPGHRDRIDKGKREKTYKIDSNIYRKISSSAHFLVKESSNCVLFLTLTFPKFKITVTDEKLNTYFSKFVENLRTNYDCGGYIAVREHGKEGDRTHFHIAIAIPYIKFCILNDIWCNCIQDICYYSKNALTSDRNTLYIRDVGRSVRYVCKYFSKCRHQVSDSRLVFCSNNILVKPVGLINANVNEILQGYKGIYVNQSEYTTCFRITDNKDFDRFCNDFLHPLFELSVKTPEYLYSFPVNSS